MNRLLRKAIVLALTGTMTLGMNAIVFAADGGTEITRDTTSKFTESGTKATDGTTEFNLIKDYDSVNPTDVAPNSSSPAETFTYEITPYAVWNAGSTYNSTTDSIGAATKITANNMPLLNVGANQTGITATEDNRKITISQKVSIDTAKYETTSDTENTGDNKIRITLPTYSTVGDYWYKVEELKGTTTGVLYGTNSNATSGTAGDTTAENGNYSGTYYIHVQVTNKSTTAGASELVSNVTMHKSAPNADIKNDVYNKTYAQTGENAADGLYKAGNKVNAIENQYYAGDLVIKKEVTGNAGDKNQYFEVTVKFTKPQGTIVNSDIKFTAIDKENNTYTNKNFVIQGQNSSTTADKTIKWYTAENTEANSTSDLQLTATVNFWVKDGTTVTFSNIPYGINYTIEETQPSEDTYTHEFAIDKEDTVTTFDGVTLTKDKATDETGDNNSIAWSNAKAVGSITDANDTVTITNNKESAIDVGVITSNAPYVAVLILAAAALVLYVRRHKDMFEE